MTEAPSPSSAAGAAAAPAVLVLGSGGREHALAHHLSQSRGGPVYCLPGNPGTADVATNLPGSVTDVEAIAKAIAEYAIGLVVSGPELPLCEGVMDALAARPEIKAQGVALLGPMANGARLEGSKVFSKEFMLRHGVPTAPARAFSRDELAAALDYLHSHSLPVVIKADGLAAGKGVTVADTLEDAEVALREALEGGAFGAAGERVLIETFMPGIEVSVFILTDGHRYLLLPEAKDYKRRYEGDRGPNTGGMGAVSPVPFFTDTLRAQVEEEIIRPTLAGLHRDGIDYRGFLFIGLMIGPDGGPRVVEYNVRLGDPETEVILPRLGGDLRQALLDAARGDLGIPTCHILEDRHTVGVVCVRQAYPASSPPPVPFTLTPPPDGEAIVYQAGTQAGHDPSTVLATGGRVAVVVGVGPAPDGPGTLSLARDRAYAHATAVAYEGQRLRTDIGYEFYGPLGEPLATRLAPLSSPFIPPIDEQIA